MVNTRIVAALVAGLFAGGATGQARVNNAFAKIGSDNYVRLLAGLSR